MLEKLLGLIRKTPDKAADSPGVKPADSRRSPHWPTVRAAHLKQFPTCAACGTSENLEVHHCEPFHLHPQLELEPTNLITLCEGETGGCHLTLGHLKLWRSFNVTIRTDAVWLLGKIKGRP